MYSSKDAVTNRKITEYASYGADRQEIGEYIPISAPQNELLNLRGTTTVDLQTAYDTDFSNVYPRPETRIDRIIDDVNDIYQDAETNFYINGFKYLNNVPSGNVSDLKSYFESTISSERNRTKSDLAILFTGKECDGSWIGIADVYNENPEQAYSVAQMVSAGAGSSYQATPDGRAILTAHELGHNFGAEHDEAYVWPSGDLNYYTVMHKYFMGVVGTYPDYMQQEFSYDDPSGHGNLTCDNIGNHILITKGDVSQFRVG